MIRLHVLGPVEASADGRPLALGGAKARAVLAMLALEANRTVSADRLVEGLWGEHPPVSAAKMVQTYVWRLRTALGGDDGLRILTRGRGYELRIDPEAVDVCRLERLLATASRVEPDGGGDAARDALALWRGPTLSDVADEPFASTAIRRLEELRVEAAELAVEADLDAGRHHEVAGRIDALIEAHPLRERLHGQRMLALYRCGRQAAALQAFRDARDTLVDEVGVEPGPELRRLHEAILRQDPALELEAGPELPRELDAAGAPPLAGRVEELAWLRGHWRHAQRRAGALVALGGAPGMGKTRLAAELAGDVHREGAAVLSASGLAGPGPALAVIAAAQEASRPTLLVLDDADRAGPEVEVALRRLAGTLGALPVLALAAGRDPDALERLQVGDARVLEALDAPAVRQIALLHAPAGAADGMPVDALLETSGGVPRRVHEDAAEWARREALRRVDAIAGRAAAGRSRARALEEELAGSVVDLRATRERAELLLVGAGPDGADGPPPCPYKGLAPFEADDTDDFFGRERLVADLVARLVGAPLLAVVGPSGSGKSSVVRAGLLPALASGVLPGSAGWARAVIRPGEHPSDELRGALGRLEARRAVLVLDQFEEVFTACADEVERARFAAELVRAIRDAEGTMLVVLALRADFYGRCGAYSELSALLAANHVLVSPMTRDELRQAIELPARRAGLGLEAGLVERLLADCEGEPGALPLLSTALVELWEERQGTLLRLAGHERTGGVRGAVARLAETAYGHLDAEQRAVARHILLRLVADDVRGTPVGRRVALQELDEGRDDVRRVLGVLAEHRLVTVSAGAVEVAHEALLREWPRLRTWLDEGAEGRRLHRQLTRAASDWSAGGRDAGELYRGARLAAALEWRADHAPELNATEQRFLEASRVARQRARRRLRAVLAGVAALLVLSTGAALVALEQRGQARAEARTAEAQQLGALAQTEEALDHAMLLARQAVALDDTPATRDSLLAALRRGPAAVGFFPRGRNAVRAIALHPDGRTLAVGDDGGRVTFVRTADRRPLGPPHQIIGAAGVSALTFSPDGTRLAATATFMRWRGVIELFDGRTGRYITQVEGRLSPTPSRPHFSPDSRVLATQEAGAERRSAAVRRWDARTGAKRPGLTSGTAVGGTSALLGVIDAGARAVTSGAAEGGTVVRDAATLRTVHRFPFFGSVAALSPAAGLVALGDPDGGLRLLDLRSGRLRSARERAGAPVVAIRFDVAGKRLLTADRDGRLTLWDPRRAAPSATLGAGPLGPAPDLQVSRDGRTAYGVSRDGRVVVWDLTGARHWERPFGADMTPSGGHPLAVAPDGSRFAVLDARGFADVFDGRTLRRTARIRPAYGRVVGAAIAPDNRVMAITTFDGVDGTVEFWDLRSRRRLGAPQTGHADPAEAVTWSADGRWLATGDTRAMVRVWDARRRTLHGTSTGGMTDLALSPDGKLLAVTLEHANPGGGLELRSVPSLEVVRTVKVPTGTVGRFSPDGRSLVYGDRGGRIWTLDTRTWRPRGRPLEIGAAVLGVALSPDGRLLAATSHGGTGRLWEVGARRPVGAALWSGEDDPIAAAFLPGGSRLAVLHERGGVVWDVRRSSWMRHACAVAGRALTRAEWKALLPRHDYAPACRRS